VLPVGEDVLLVGTVGKLLLVGPTVGELVGELIPPHFDTMMTMLWKLSKTMRPVGP
jgi:hypothetical protein